MFQFSRKDNHYIITIQPQNFEYNDACFSIKIEHEKTKEKLSKIIDSGEQVNGEFSISREVLGEGMAGIVYKGKLALIFNID